MHEEHGVGGARLDEQQGDPQLHARGEPLFSRGAVEPVVKPSVHPDTHRLVVDPHEPLVANARARAMTGRNAGHLGAHGDHRIDEHHQIGPLLLGDIEVPDAAHAAVDVVAVTDANGAVKQGQRRRRTAGPRERHVVVTGGAEEDPVARVEVVGHHTQRPREPREAARDAPTKKELFEEALECVEGEEPGGERIVETIQLLPRDLWGTPCAK